MLRINLPKLLRDLENASGQKWPMRDVAANSGCDASTLSRLINHPENSPSGVIIDKLAQFFFREFKKHRKVASEMILMKEIVNELVSVYPDAEEYWQHLPPEAKEGPTKMSVDAMWSIHEKASQTKIQLLGSIGDEIKEYLQNVKGIESKSEIEATWNEILVSAGRKAAIRERARLEAKTEEGEKSQSEMPSKKKQKSK